MHKIYNPLVKFSYHLTSTLWLNTLVLIFFRHYNILMHFQKTFDPEKE